MYLSFIRLTCLVVALGCCFFSQEKFYLEAHVGSEPANFAKKTIRGQLVQKFTATLTGSNEVSPFKGAKNTSGKATVSFEDAGKVACFDASFFKTSTSSSVPASSFVYADVHFGDKGKNGEIVLKFTPTRVSDERFYGCLTLKELGAVGVQVIADILADPVSYYVHAHVGKTGTDDFNVAIRGQLEYYK
jgi:CHRD domain